MNLDFSPNLSLSYNRLLDAIVDGNPKEMKSIMQNYEGNPQKLSVVVNGLRDRLENTGYTFSYAVCRQMYGQGQYKEFRDVGILRVGMKDAPYSLCLWTDHRMGIEVAHRGASDGMWCSTMTSPEAALGEMVRHAGAH